LRPERAIFWNIAIIIIMLPFQGEEPNLYNFPKVSPFQGFTLGWNMPDFQSLYKPAFQEIHLLSPLFSFCTDYKLATWV